MKKRSSQYGFTLIEVVITIFIVVLMLVFFVSAFITNRLTRIQQHRDVAIRVANLKMTSLRQSGYSGVTAGTFTDPLLNTLTNASASTTVSDYNANIKQVTVGVSWIDASTTMYVSETTLMVNSGGL